MTLLNRSSRKTGLSTRRVDALAGVLFVLPVVALFLVFRYIPLANAVQLSFTEFRLNGASEWVGIDNYTRLIGDHLFWESLGVTGLYALIAIPLTLVVSMVGALLLNAVTRFVGVFRTLLFLPYVTSLVMAGLIWEWMYAPDGPINLVLNAMSLPDVGFLTGDQIIVLASLAVVSTWRGFGYSMLIFLAGLKALSPDVQEAARIDGANGWQRFWRVTMPMLRPVTFFVLVVEVISTSQAFDVMYTMTGGGPANASLTLIYYLYNQGFKFFDFGYAATIGIALFVIILIVSLVQRRVLAERKY